MTSDIKRVKCLEGIKKRLVSSREGKQQDRTSRLPPSVDFAEGEIALAKVFGRQGIKALCQWPCSNYSEELAQHCQGLLEALTLLAIFLSCNFSTT